MFYIAKKSVNATDYYSLIYFNMKRNLKFNENLVEQFDAQEMVMLTGGNKFFEAVEMLFDALMDKLINGSNCECHPVNYKCN